MINQSLRTQLQAKINAASAATPLNELMLMRVAAQGMNVDETNLDTLIPTKVNAVVSADPAVSFVEAWRSLALLGNVTYQTPVAVAAGDELYIDALGKVKTEKYPMRGAVATTNVPLSDLTLNSQHVALRNSVSAGPLATNSGTSGGAGFSADLTLSDGNRLRLTAAKADATQQLVFAAVIGADETTVVSTHTLTALVNGSDVSTGTQVVGAFEVSANVFRIYYTTGGPGFTSAYILRYVTLTYNTGTKALSSAAGATIATSADTGAFYRAFAPHRQGDRYVIVGASGTGALWCLDMQTSSVITYTGTTSITYATEFDLSTAGSEAAYVLAGTTPKILRAGADVTITVPANVITDGCFGSTWQVILIGPRMFLCVKAANPVKLVKFSTNWATASIYTVASLVPPSVVSAANARSLVLRSDGNRFFVKTDIAAPMFSFVWDGASAPVSVDTSCGWLMTTPAVSYFRTRLPLITSSDRVTYSMLTGRYVGDGVSTYTFNMVNYFSFDGAEFTGYTPAKLGDALTAAAANGLAELSLSPETQSLPTAQVPLRSEIVYARGLRSTLKRDRMASKVDVLAYPTGTMTVQNFAGPYVDQVRAQDTPVSQSPLSLAAGAALLSSPNVALSVSAGGNTAGLNSAAALVVLAVDGADVRNSDVTAANGYAARVSAYVESDKPLYVAFAGRTGTVHSEREL